jgi:hypothetical protein
MDDTIFEPGGKDGVLPKTARSALSAFRIKFQRN